jgi:two-component system, OmpR family, KDP operon response regulator KdpE
MTQAMHRVLIVEDDPAISKVVSLLFETDGYRVVTADTCELGVRRAQSYRPDVCIIDLGLPDRDGITFIHRVREWSSVPIIVLTARTPEVQRLAAFEAGADDYVIKPFSGPELLARTRAILRRVMRSEHPSAVVKFGNVVVDLTNRVTRGGPAGEDARLTPLEHRVLECLIRQSDGIVTHAQLMREVWGPHQDDVRSLRVYIASLRRKIEPDPSQPRFLLTESGIGYRLVTDPEAKEPAESPSVS